MKIRMQPEPFHKRFTINRVHQGEGAYYGLFYRTRWKGQQIILSRSPEGILPLLDRVRKDDPDTYEVSEFWSLGMISPNPVWLEAWQLKHAEQELRRTAQFIIWSQEIYGP